MDLENLYLEFFEAGCVKFGEFKLKSGILSPIYIDFRLLISRPALLRKVGKALAEKIATIDCDLVAGIPYAGLPIATAVALESGKPMVYPRKEIKEHGTAQRVEGIYSPGEKAAVLDDIITDGASKIEAIKPLEDVGIVVKDVLVILDREQGGSKILEAAGYQLSCLGTLSEILNTLASAGKISPELDESVREFIAANQFA